MCHAVLKITLGGHTNNYEILNFVKDGREASTMPTEGHMIAPEQHVMATCRKKVCHSTQTEF